MQTNQIQKIQKCESQVLPALTETKIAKEKDRIDDNRQESKNRESHKIQNDWIAAGKNLSTKNTKEPWM